MFKKTLAVITLFFGFLLTLSAGAQELQAPTAAANTISVGADGKFEAEPDTALLQFNISIQDGKAKIAYERASKSAEQIRQVLRDNGIDPKSVEIGYFSVTPIYDWGQSKHKPKAYRVSASTKLKLKDFEKVGPIEQQLADTDVTENLLLTYTLENIDAAKRKAVEDAYRRVNDSAMTVAQASGRTLSELSYASVDTIEQVQLQGRRRTFLEMSSGVVAESAMPRKEMEYAAPTSEFSPQAIVVTAHVNAVFVLK
jgi:uncharacterized protein YggE